MSTSALAGGFSFGFSYNDYPRYYRSPAYVYYDRSPVYVDYAPGVVVYDAPRVYSSPPVVYRDYYPRYYRSSRIYTRSYGYCDYPRYSYRHYDHRPRFRGHVGARW
jgi:hypothetical protein